MKVKENLVILKFLKLYGKYENKAFRIFSVIGTLILLRKFFKVLNELIPWHYFKNCSPQRYGEGSWALITGTTNDLGRALAYALAQRGFSLCLLGRNYEKLNNLKLELQGSFKNIFIHTITIDFQDSLDQYFLESIQNEIDDLDISIMVNNVGGGIIDNFTEIKEKKIKEFLLVTSLPLIKLCHYILKKMKLRKNKKSAIINVSSIAGLYPCPYFSVYSSLEAFIDMFSRSLAKEAGKDIDILSVRPFLVAKSVSVLGKLFGFITPSECAQSILSKVGVFNVSYGHWKHVLQGNILEIIPDIFKKMFFKFLGPYILKKEKEHRQRSARINLQFDNNQF